MSNKYIQYYDWQPQGEIAVSDIIDAYDYVDIEVIFDDRTSSIVSVGWIEDSYKYTDNNGEEIYDEYTTMQLTDEDGNDIYETDIIYGKIIKERCV